MHDNTIQYNVNGPSVQKGPEKRDKEKVVFYSLVKIVIINLKQIKSIHGGKK